MKYIALIIGSSKGVVLLLLCVVFLTTYYTYGFNKPKESELLALSGVILSFECSKNNLRSFKLTNNVTIKPIIINTTSCKEAKDKYTGSQIEAMIDTESSKAFKLSINGSEMYGYTEAVQVLEKEEKDLIGISWVILGIIGFFILIHTTKKHLTNRSS